MNMTINKVSTTLDGDSSGTLRVYGEIKQVLVIGSTIASSVSVAIVLTDDTSVPILTEASLTGSGLFIPKVQSHTTGGTASTYDFGALSVLGDVTVTTSGGVTGDDVTIEVYYG